MDQQMPNQTPMEQGDTNQPAVSKWLWITLIVVIVLAAIYFIWYYTMGSGKKTESTTNTETTTEVDETADWQTYTSTDYRYSIKYPTDYSAKDWADTIKTGAAAEPNKDLLSVVGFGDNTKLADYEISVTVTSDTLERRRTLACYEMGTDRVETQETVAGVQWYKITCNSVALPNDMVPDIKREGGEKIINYVFQKDNFVFVILYNQESLANDTKTIFDNMLSTFKFTTTATSATADWKTYTNTAYGFSFKYPNNLALLSTSKDNAVSFGADGNSLWVFEVDSAKTTKTLTQANAEKISELTGSTSSDATVGGKPAKKFITPAGYSGNTIYLIVDSGNLYNIIIREDNATYQSMISTFQFTN